jgi:prepilin-type N-terminal cleavage/methylation domain-containing protein
MRGFTLLEVLVALVLFQFGMLALAATSAVVARDFATATRRVRAHTLARQRAELLRSSACGAPGTGTSLHADGLRESWRVQALDARRSVTVTVEFGLPRGRSDTVVERAWAICAQ